MCSAKKIINEALMIRIFLSHFVYYDLSLAACVITAISSPQRNEDEIAVMSCTRNEHFKQSRFSLI